MKLHANARTCPNSRRLLVRRIEEEGWSLMAAAEAAGISERSARKWLGRWRAEGDAGLSDRSSAPKRIPHRTPEAVVKTIAALRRLRMTAAEIAEVLGLALSTVSLWLKRIGLGKRSALAPPEPPNRYERNGKAERFIQTMLREWAYGRLYGSSTERRAALGGWLDRYNYRRKHGSLGHRPPAARLSELLGNNLVGNYS